MNLRYRTTRALGVATAFFLLSMTVSGQPLQFAGAPFGHLLTLSDPLSGAETVGSASDIINDGKGLYLFLADDSRGRTGIVGGDTVFYLSNAGLEKLLSLEDPLLAGSPELRFVGFRENGELLFKPINNFPTKYPLYQWDGTEISEFLPVDSVGYDLVYADGKIAYLDGQNLSVGERGTVYAGEPGHAVPLVDGESASGFWAFHGFDGKQVVFERIPEGRNSSATELLVRSLDGETHSIFHPDAVPAGLPSGYGYTFDNTSLSPVLMTSKAVYYLIRGSSGVPRAPGISVFMKYANGNNEILWSSLSTGIGSRGMTFEIEAIETDRIWVSVAASGGTSGLYLYENGDWTLVFEENALFGDEPVTDYAFYPNGFKGDTLAVNVLTGNRRAYTSNLYANLPFAAPETLQIELQTSGTTGDFTLQFTGTGGSGVRVYSSVDLLNWTVLEESLPLDEKTAELPLSPGTGPVFYRAEEVD